MNQENKYQIPYNVNEHKEEFEWLHISNMDEFDTGWYVVPKDSILRQNGVITLTIIEDWTTNEK